MPITSTDLQRRGNRHKKQLSLVKEQSGSCLITIVTRPIKRRSFQNACRKYTASVPKVKGLITKLLCKYVDNTQFALSIWSVQPNAEPAHSCGVSQLPKTPRLPLASTELSAHNQNSIFLATATLIFLRYWKDTMLRVTFSQEYSRSHYKMNLATNL